MINRLTVLAVLCFCLFCFSGTAAAQKDEGKNDDVLRALKSYDEAWNKKDSAAVDQILAADYIYFTSNGGTTSRQRTLDFLRSPNYILTFVERSEINAYRTGDTAVVSSRWKGRGTYDKEQINDDQRCSLVFSKVKRDWKLTAEHCTQIVSK